MGHVWDMLKSTGYGLKNECKPRCFCHLQKNHLDLNVFFFLSGSLVIFRQILISSGCVVDYGYSETRYGSAALETMMSTREQSCNSGQQE